MLSFDYSPKINTGISDLKRKYPNLMKIAEENQNSIYEAMRQLYQLSLTENLEVLVDKNAPKHLIPVIESFYIFDHITNKANELGINIEEYVDSYETELVQLIPTTYMEDMEYVKSHASSFDDLALVPQTKLEVFHKTIKVISEFVTAKLYLPRLNVIIKYV